MEKPFLPWIVGLISIVPLWLGAYWVYNPVAGLLPSSILSLTSIYGGVYLAFIAGSKWGVISTGATTRWPAMQMLLALIFILIGLAAAILPAPFGLGGLLTGFMVMALWDIAHSQSGTIVLWYARLRVWLTILAIAPLVVLLLKVL